MLVLSWWALMMTVPLFDFEDPFSLAIYCRRILT